MVERVLLGRHPDTGDVGLWVTRPTKNARTSTNLDDFLVHPDKVNQRPFARIAPVKFTRGAFVRTITYSDGTKGDEYIWRADYYHNFGYVPIILVQLESNTGGVSYQRPPWVDAAHIYISPYVAVPYTYATGSPSTPIITNSNSTWQYTISDNTFNYVGSAAPTTYTIYRNPIT